MTYFKIEKTSATGLKIAALFARIKANNMAQIELVNELTDIPGSAIFCEDPAEFAGKLYAIEFKNHPGAMWAELKWHNAYPKRLFKPSARTGKAYDQLRQKFSSSDDPISHHDFCSLLHLKSPFWDDHTYYRTPGFGSGLNVYVFKVAEKWAESIKEPNPDMIEILASEYHRHLEESKAAKVVEAT
jgi:hypothetical protein